MNQFLTADVDDEQWGVNSTLSWDVGGGSTIRLINNYRDWENEQLDGDVIFTPSPILSRTGTFDSKSQNHELQFISPTEQWLDGRLDLVAGLYYFHEKYEQGEQLHMNAQFCKIAPCARRGPLQRLPRRQWRNEGGCDRPGSQPDRWTAMRPMRRPTSTSPTSSSRRSADASARTRRKGRYDQLTNPLLASVRAAESLTLPDVNDEKFTYRLGLNYEPNEDLLFFGSYSTGYKSAGYNSGAGSPSLTTRRAATAADVVRPERRVFDRETTENWELGAKTSWLESQADANLTFYRMDINGFQDRAFDGTSFTVRNAGNLRHQGFEFDGVAKPLRNLSLFASVAYLDSEFTEYDNAPAFRVAPHVIAGVPTFRPLARRCRSRDRRQDLEGRGSNIRARMERPRRLRLDRRFRLQRYDLGPELEPVVRFEAVWRPASTTATRRRSSMAMRCSAPARPLNGPATAGRSRCSATTCSTSSMKPATCTSSSELTWASNNGVFTGQHGRPAAARRSAHLRCVGYLPLLVPSWGRGKPGAGPTAPGFSFGGQLCSEISSQFEYEFWEWSPAPVIAPGFLFQAGQPLEQRQAPSHGHSRRGVQMADIAGVVQLGAPGAGQAGNLFELGQRIVPACHHDGAETEAACAEWASIRWRQDRHKPGSRAAAGSPRRPAPPAARRGSGVSAPAPNWRPSARRRCAPRSRRRHRCRIRPRRAH